MENCSICAESFTSVKRKPVNCPRCDFQCCLSCLKRQCLNGTDPICMNPDCRTQFENAFLYEQFPKAFLDGLYKEKRTDVLWQREQGMLDNTMPFVEARMTVQSMENELNELIKHSRELEKRVIAQKRLVSESRMNYYRLESGVEQIAKEKKNFIRKCTNGECRGFLNSRYRCELCNTQVCSKCFETKEEGHICDEDMVKTAELLRKDTKPCPNCAEMIYKISGCDQMYCTTCHTAFSWNTGNIVTGVVHNPHYFEYRRQNGGVPRQPGDIPCGGIPTPFEIRSRLREIIGVDMGGVTVSELLRFLQFSQHYRNVVIPNYQDVVDRSRNPEAINRKLRIRYLMNELSESDFKSGIYKTEYEINSRREYLHIYTTMTTLIEDQLQRFMHDDTNSVDQVMDIVGELKNIVVFINNCFQQLANTYKKKTPLIVVPIEAYSNNRIKYLIEQHNGTIPQKKKN